MKTSTKIWLIIILLLTIGVRLYLAFSIDGLSYEAYGTLRHVENIKETGLPLFSDDLSFGGRERFFSPIYHYFLAIFSFLMSDELLIKIIPNILSSLTILVVFNIGLFFSKDENASLLAALFSGFIPVFYYSTLNNGSVYNAVIPLFFLSIYYFLKTTQNSSHLNKLIVCLVLLSVVHPTALILALTFVIYLVLIKSIGFRESSKEPEIVLFYLIFVLWITMLFYKAALSTHGLDVIWQNLPLALMGESFVSLSTTGSIYGIGILPLIFGLAGVYINLFSSKSKSATLMISLCLVIFIMLWFKFIEFNFGLIFLGVALSVLASYSLAKMRDSISKFKFKNSTRIFYAIIILILIVSFIPTYSLVDASKKNTPSQRDIQAYKWLSRTKENSTVLAFPKEGSVMSYFSNKKNVMDEDYLTVKNIDQRFEDVMIIYESSFYTSALQKLDYYSVDYVVLSENAQRQLKRSDFLFEDSVCFPKIYPKEDISGPKIYWSKCALNRGEDR